MWPYLQRTIFVSHFYVPFPLSAIPANLLWGGSPLGPYRVMEEEAWRSLKRLRSGRLPARALGALRHRGWWDDAVLRGISDLPDEEIEATYRHLTGSMAGFQAFRAIVGAAAASTKVVLTREARAYRLQPLQGIAPAFPAAFDSRAAHPATRWPTTYRRLLASGVPRAEAEELERQRWIHELTEVIIAAQLPAAGTLALSPRPGEILARCAGGRRSSTLRQRMRTWRKLAAWLHAVYETGYPQNVFQVIDHLNDRAREPCGTSYPQSLLSALAFIEEAGNVPMGERLSASPLLRAAIADVERELRTGKLRDVKKAPRVPVAVLASLEAVVCSPEAPVFMRGFAWLKLVKVWGALRCDDLRHMPPSRVKLSDRGLSFVLEQTKTTGPGKKVNTLVGYVAKEAYIAFREWLSTGFHIWAQIKPSDRYFLGLPSKSLGAVRPIEASYWEISLMSRALLASAPHMERYADEGGVFAWRPTGRYLMRSWATQFWTEHSDRATLVSWAAALGISREDRDFLGRWKPEASDMYVRTARLRVEAVQRRIAEATRSAEADIFMEDDLLSSLASQARARGISEEEALAQVADLTAFNEDGFVCLPSREGEAGPEIPEPLTGGTMGPLAASPLEALSESEIEGGTFLTPSVPQGSLVVSTSRKAGRKRLHLVGACGRIPGVHYLTFEVVETAPREADVARCRQCWPTAGSLPTVSHPSDSSGKSSSGDSSSSSDSSEADLCPERLPKFPASARREDCV